MDPGLLADTVVVVHLLYVGFTVGGEMVILAGAALGWRWTRNLAFRTVHLVACIFVAFEALAGILCPLTEWEHALRERANQQVEQELTFVARLIRSIIFYDFPLWVFTAAYVAFGLAVLTTFVLYRPLSPRREAGGDSPMRGEASRRTASRKNPSRGSRRSSQPDRRCERPP